MIWTVVCPRTSPKVFDIVRPQSRNHGLVNNIVKTSLCQRNAFGNIVLAHNGTFGTMQVGALPNGITDQLHQIDIALSGLSGSRQKIVLYGQTSRDKAIAHRERYLHMFAFLRNRLMVNHRLSYYHGLYRIISSYISLYKLIAEVSSFRNLS